MHVRIKILQGSNAGKVLNLPVPKCVIGRGDDCHLRPQSDAVSRRHCEIVTNDTEVAVRDLGSRNGTCVNGELIAQETLLLSGDVLKIGPLEFEMQIEHTAAKLKRPKIVDIKQAVSRTAEVASNSTQDLSDVFSWLEEGDKADKRRKHGDPDTRQFRVDETSPPDTGDATKSDMQVAASADTKALKPDLKKPDKKPPGKLPPRPVTQTKDSREAAADMLKKLFNRR